MKDSSKLIKQLRKEIKELEQDLMEATELYYEEGFQAGFELGKVEGYDEGWAAYDVEVELALHDYEGKVQ